jgi:hypothetical protein
MPPNPAVNILEVLAAHLDEGLIGALDDPLAADVDPGSRRHLTVHGQALAIEFVEVFPRGPMRHEVGIRDQHAWRIHMGRENADRLARLHQQGFVIAQCFQGLDDAVVAIPVASGAADAAVHDEFGGILRHVRIEIVHEHAQGCFRLP